MTDDLTDLEALAQAATPGPWRWRNTQEVYLLGDWSKVVMAFRRMGMNGAQPEFRGADGLLFPAGRENLHAIPDAAFIAAARDAVPALIARVRKAEAALAGADRPDPCQMTHTEPFDFAQCETHDTTFALGEKCEWDGVESITQHLEDKADQQRARAVIAEAERDEALDALARVEALIPTSNPELIEGGYAVLASDLRAALPGGDDRG